MHGYCQTFLWLKDVPTDSHGGGVYVVCKELREVVEDIVVGEGLFFGDLQWMLASLPIRFGGLGLYSGLEASSYAFVASRAQSWVLQDHILRDSGLCGMDSDFDNALDGLRGTIPNFDVSSFTSKDIVPPKAQHVLASALCSKSVQDMDVKFDMTTRRKAILDVCKQHMLKIFF